LNKRNLNTASAKLKRNIPEIITALFFPLAMVYYEIIFKLCTGGKLICLGSLVMIFFAMFLGGFLWLLSTISKRAWLNRTIGAVLLFIFAVMYLVEYFVVRQFQMFYDTNTVFAGAGGVLSKHTGDIKALIFCFDGISKILLFFLPGILLLSAGAYFMLCRKVNRNKRILTMSLVLECYLMMFLTVTFTPSLARLEKGEYEFEAAVKNFGLMRSVYLDLFAEKESIENADFDKETTDISDMSLPDISSLPTAGTPGNGVTPPDSSGSTGTQAPTTDDPDASGTAEPPVTKPTHITDRNPMPSGTNSLDIDFANLETSNKTHAKLNEYVAGLTPSNKNKYTGLFKGKNLIMISAEAFASEAIDPELTPTLYRMATKGINFTDYYQPASAGTTGGEYQNVFGMLPMKGGSSFKNSAKTYNYFTMGSQLDRLGYYGKAYHNNSYTYYDRHKTHVNLGYSDGYMGYGNGMEQYVKKAWPQSDLEMISGTLTEYIDKQPFNIYYMSVSGHSAYTRAGNSMTKKNWDKVEHLEGSEEVKGYKAAQLELEYAMAHLISELEKKGIADDTVICISTDHFPYGLNDDLLAELYGYKITNSFQRHHNRLILWCGELEKYDPIIVSSPTSSLDILPTLSNLFGTEYDSRLMVGRDVFSDTPALVFNTGYEWKTDYGTYVGGKFIPTYEDLELPDNYVSSIKSIVKFKIMYCTSAPESDYFKYLFKK